MAFPFTPQQPQQSPFQQSNPFQSQQPQQSPFQLQFQQPQQQLQSQQQLFLFTNDKAPASYGTKWADLHPDSQKFLLQIEEKIMEYRDESQRLDQCSRLYDSSIANNSFELAASSMVQELGGISIAMERQKATLNELVSVIRDMLRHTEIAVRSFMMLRPRFIHQNKPATGSPTAPSQQLVVTQTSSSPPANSIVPILDFYSGLPKKPCPFLQQTVARFEKDLSECRQWVEELEQLLLSESDNSHDKSSSLFQSLPKVMKNVHDFFVHVAAKVESIHQYIESMKTAYLVDQRRRGDGNDPFLEADRRETAKQEAAARRVHPTLHLPAVSQPTGQAVGSVGIVPASVVPSATNVPATGSTTAASGLSFLTPAATSTTSMFSTPLTTTTPFASSLGTDASQSSPFSTLSKPAFGGSTPLFGSTPASNSAFGGSTPLFGSTPASNSAFGGSTPALNSAFGGSTPLFGSTPGVASTLNTSIGTAAAGGSSFGSLSKARSKSRTGRR